MPTRVPVTGQDFKTGLKAGIPFCIGYFPAVVAFGLLARNGGVHFFDKLLFSMTNLAGASQFLALNLGGAG